MSFCSIKTLGNQSYILVDFDSNSKKVHVMCWHRGPLTKKIKFGVSEIEVHPDGSLPDLPTSGYNYHYVTHEQNDMLLLICNQYDMLFPNMIFEEQHAESLEDQEVSIWHVKIDLQNSVYITVVIENNTGGGLGS